MRHIPWSWTMKSCDWHKTSLCLQIRFARVKVMISRFTSACRYWGATCISFSDVILSFTVLSLLLESWNVEGAEDLCLAIRTCTHLWNDWQNTCNNLTCFAARHELSLQQLKAHVGLRPSRWHERSHRSCQMNLLLLLASPFQSLKRLNPAHEATLLLDCESLPILQQPCPHMDSQISNSRYWLQISEQDFQLPSVHLHGPQMRTCPSCTSWIITAAVAESLRVNLTTQRRSEACLLLSWVHFEDRFQWKWC